MAVETLVLRITTIGAFAHWGGANGDLRETMRNQTVTISSPPADGDYHIVRLTGIGNSTTTSFIENFNTYPHGETLNRGMTGWWELGSRDKNAGLAIMVDSGMARVYRRRERHLFKNNESRS